MDELKHGFVLITDGPYKGCIGLYSGDVQGKGYVYFRFLENGEPDLVLAAFVLDYSVMKNIEVEFSSPCEAEEVCIITGSEISFTKEVPLSQIKEVAQDIWDNPSKYSDYKDGSDQSYYGFLKYLWIEFPDGGEARLASYVSIEEETDAS